jgi:hypothetical protein
MQNQQILFLQWGDNPSCCQITLPESLPFSGFGITQFVETASNCLLLQNK